MPQGGSVWVFEFKRDPQPAWPRPASTRRGLTIEFSGLTIVDGRAKLPLRKWMDGIRAESGAALVRLIEDSRGVTAIEYALIGALITVAAIAAFTLVGTNLSTTFSYVASQL